MSKRNGELYCTITNQIQQRIMYAVAYFDEQNATQRAQSKLYVHYFFDAELTDPVSVFTVIDFEATLEGWVNEKSLHYLQQLV